MTLHTSMSTVLVGYLAGGDVPQEDSFIKTTRAQLRAVARALGIDHLIAVPGVCLEQQAATTRLQLVWVPQLYGLVSSACHAVVTIS